MENIFKESDLDWMTVRPVTLKDGEPMGKPGETSYYGLRNKISRGDVANWMLDSAEREQPFLSRTPMISFN